MSKISWFEAIFAIKLLSFAIDYRYLCTVIFAIYSTDPSTTPNSVTVNIVQIWQGTNISSLRLTIPDLGQRHVQLQQAPPRLTTYLHVL